MKTTPPRAFLDHPAPRPGSAAGAAALPAGQALAFTLLVLLFASINIGIVFFQLRGVPPAGIGLIVLGYHAGLLLAALALDAFVRPDRAGPAAAARAAVHSVASRTGPAAPAPEHPPDNPLAHPRRFPIVPPIAWGVRAALVFFMVLPAFFCLVYFRFMPLSGTPFVNVFLSSLWGVTQAVTLRLFFRHAPPEKQALYLGIAMGVGHVCWSLITPMAGGLEPDSPFFAASGERFFSFLNLARGLICLAASALVWKLTGPGPVQSDSATREETDTAVTPAAGSGAGDGLKPDFAPAGCSDSGPCSVPGFVPDSRPEPGPESGPGSLPARELVRRAFFLLLPLALCCALNGVIGYLFLSRLQPSAMSLEYAHLAMTVFFPLAGLLVSRKGADSLRFFLGGAAICFVAAPLSFPASAPVWLTQAVYLACAAGLQALLFAGMLALARLLPYTRRPALLLCLPWMCYLFSVAGRIAAAKLLPNLGVSSLAAACALAVLCAASVPLLRRAFPLPEPPAAPATPLPPLAPPGQATAPDAAARNAKLAAFTAAFSLSGREAEVLHAIIRQLPMERICAEMGISERTVRFHQTGLFKKTATLNRRRLALFFSAWKPE